MTEVGTQNDPSLADLNVDFARARVKHRHGQKTTVVGPSKLLSLQRQHDLVCVQHGFVHRRKLGLNCHAERTILLFL